MKRMFFKKEIVFYQRPRFIIPAVLLALLIGLRIIGPAIILDKVNAKLEEVKPVVTAHIDDLDLSILRGTVTAEGITARLKKNGATILKVAETDVSLAWPELLKGKVLLDVVTTNAEVIVKQEYLAELKKMPKTENKKEEPAVKLSRFELRDSLIDMADLPGEREGETLVISDIELRVTNLTPNDDNPYSYFTLSAGVPGDAIFRGTGRLDLKATPPAWDLDGEMKSMNLNAMNQLLKDKVPLTFKHGTLDLYTEVKSEDGRIEGYVKPFLNQLDIVGNKSDFKGVRHGFFEVVGAIGNLLMQNQEVKSVATKIPFSFTKTLKIDQGEALEKVIQHGFKEKLKPGVENKLQLE